MAMKMMTMDGNTAAAYVSYVFTDGSHLSDHAELDYGRKNG